MTALGWLLILVILAAVVAAAVPLGAFIARAMTGERTFLTPVLRPVERGFYALAGVNPEQEQSWRAYALAMLAFSAVGFFSLYGLQRLQSFLPLNPQGFDGVAPDLSFNTAISFLTNTNWQNYGGETTMSHLTQMLGLTVHNFLSAATGLAMAIALVRAFTRSQSATIGNFWVDMTRATLYLLLPLSIVMAFVMVASGIPQTLLASVDAPPWKAPNKRSRSGRSRARKRSRRSAPTAAASSTPIRRTPTRRRASGSARWRSGPCC